MNSRNATGTDVMTPVLALEKQGRLSRALRLVDALLAAEGPSPELIAAKARALARRGDTPALVLRAVVGLMADDKDGALADAREASALDPDHEMAAMFAIVVNLAQGQLDEVIIQAEAASLKENLTVKLPAGLAYL